MKHVVLNDYPKYRNRAGEKSGYGSQDSEWEPGNQKAKKNALCSTALQSVGVGRWPVLFAGRMGKTNGFGLAPSIHDGNIPELPDFPELSDYKSALCSTTLQSIGVFMKTENHCAQRHSKVSESGGGPFCLLAAWAKQMCLI